MVSKRKRFSELEVLLTLWHQDVFVPCFRCNDFIIPVKLGPKLELHFPAQREHLHEVALGGPDVPANCRYSHTACHDKITNGTKATSAGSSKHRIAKAKRIEREAKFVVKRTVLCFEGEEHELAPPQLIKAPPKRKWPKGRKLESKGFQERPAGYKHNWSWQR